MGVIYFVTPHDGVELEPVTESPLVQRMDLSKLRFVDGKVPTMEKYRKQRVMNYGGSQPMRPGPRKDVEQEDLGGVIVQHYN